MAEYFRANSFDKIYQRLEQLSELKKKNLLEDAEYQELRSLFLTHLKDAISSGLRELKEPTSPLEVNQTDSPPYGQLHLQIVKKIRTSYKGAEGDAKQRMFRAMAEMAEKQALNPGDSADIEEIIEIAFTSLPDHDNIPREEVYSELLKILKALHDIHSKVEANPNSSPAAKAIAEITHQSANEAADEIRSQRNKVTPGKLWGRLVLEDLEGCLQGGAAAVGLFQPFSTAFGAWSLPVVAALGVVVGAGIRSGIAYGEVKSQS